jgi:hypothetical protein
VASSKTLLDMPARGATANVTSVTWPTDPRLIAWGESDGSAHVYDLALGEVIASVHGHASSVSSVRLWSGPGRPMLLATGGADTTILLWDLSRGRKPRDLPRTALDAAGIAGLIGDMAGDDTTRILPAIWRLSDGGEPVVRALVERYPPAGVDKARQASIARWIVELDADEYGVRVEAYRQLDAAGHEASAPMRDALEKAESAEVKDKLGDLLKALASRPQSAPAKVLGAMRATMVLEQIASPAALAHLKALAGDALSGPLARDAQDALARLAIGR